MSDLIDPVKPFSLTPSTTEESHKWSDRARKVLAGGISSSARATTTTAGVNYPLYITHGRGGRIWDADGNQFVDHLLSYGSIILGHADPELTDLLSDQLALGTMFGTCNTLEVELAETICRLVPCADLVRYANSGSEAMCGAVRAARGYTGRSKLLKFEGHYHGWVDLLAVSNRPTLEEAGPADHPNSAPHSRGIPSSVVEDVIVAPWNDPAALAAILDHYKGQIAAVVAEPIVANNACTMPAAGFLEFLRAECDRRGIVLIFDEIVTGFRLAPGGAQQYFNVIPDLAVFSKALGNGTPISAFAGKREIMDLVGANTVKHGGTYNGNPLCAAAGLFTLRKLSRPGKVEHIRSIGDEISTRITAAARRHEIPCVVQGTGAMFQVVFGTDRPLVNYRDLVRTDTKRYAAFRDALLRQAVHVNSSGAACWFVSLAHTADDIDHTCRAIDVAMKQIA